jgi:hypothetical protein
MLGSSLNCERRKTTFADLDAQLPSLAFQVSPPRRPHSRLVR